MKERNVNCDILRILACFFVILVHALLYCGFYKEVTKGPAILGLHIVRCFLMVCVPVFIILSGYLMKDKELNKGYLKKILRVIVCYLLCSGAYIAALVIKSREFFPIKDVVLRILSFEAPSYSWYVSMYLGLFLIIPFLNILWKNTNKKQREYLIIILFIIICLPTLVNIFNFDSFSWWKEPVRSSTYNLLMPDFWCGMGYPILYYFIGCYLKDYKPKIKTSTSVLLLVVCSILFGIFNYYRTYNGLFGWEIFTENFSFEVVILSAIFSNLFLNQIKIKINSKKIKNFLAKISYLTFGAYLLSAIFDHVIYPYLVTYTSGLNDRIIYMIPIALVIFVLSMIASFFVDLIQKFLFKMYYKLRGMEE